MYSGNVQYKMSKIVTVNMCWEKYNKMPKNKKAFLYFSSTGLIFKAICIHFRRITEQLRS